VDKAGNVVPLVGLNLKCVLVRPSRTNCNAFCESREEFFLDILFHRMSVSLSPNREETKVTLAVPKRSIPA